MEYLRLYFKDNDGYYGDFIIKNDIENIKNLLICIRKSKGIMITDIFDNIFIETNGSYINKAYDLNITKEMLNIVDSISKKIKLCTDYYEENEVLKKLESLLVDCENIKIVNNINKLEYSDEDYIEMQLEDEPIFAFAKSARIIKNNCKKCSNYEYICQGDVLCRPYEGITASNLYLKMYIDKIEKDLNYNNFILMRMCNDIKSMNEVIDYAKEFTNEDNEDKWIEELKEDYEYALNLSDKEIEDLVKKYNFNNMYTSFKFENNHKQELEEYYFEKLKEKINHISKKKNENINEYIDLIESFMHYDEEFYIVKDYLSKDYCNYYEEIIRNLKQEYDFYYDKKNKF